MRLHGRNREGYLKGKTAAEQHEYLYTPAELAESGPGRIKAFGAKAPELRVVANNHAQDFAPRTALELTRLVGETAQEWGCRRRNENTMQSARNTTQVALAAEAAAPTKPKKPKSPAITAKAKKNPANSNIP